MSKVFANNDTIIVGTYKVIKIGSGWKNMSNSAPKLSVTLSDPFTSTKAPILWDLFILLFTYFIHRNENYFDCRIFCKPTRPFPHENENGLPEESSVCVGEGRKFIPPSNFESLLAELGDEL